MSKEPNFKENKLRYKKYLEQKVGKPTPYDK